MTTSAVSQAGQKRSSRSVSHKRMVAKARRLRKKGLNARQIGEQLGAKPKTVSTWLPKTAADPVDAISGQVLCQWLEAHGIHDPQHGFLIEGKQMTPTMQRAHHRWRNQEVNPGLNSAERAILFFNCTFYEFEQWAEANDLCIWARGKAPEFWSLSGDSLLLEDLNSSDPEWVKEAREQGKANGMLDACGRRRRLKATVSPPERQGAKPRERELVAA